MWYYSYLNNLIGSWYYSDTAYCPNGYFMMNH